MNDEIVSSPDSRAMMPFIKVKPLHTLTNKQRSKSRHATLRQREKMVEVILKNPELFRGQKGVRAEEKWKKAWEDLTLTLNSLGPPRRLHLWHKMWKNMIARVKEKKAIIDGEARVEEDMSIVEPLNDMEQDILKFITLCKGDTRDNSEMQKKVLKTYPGKAKSSSLAEVVTSQKDAEDSTDTAMDFEDSLTHWINSPDAAECPEMQIKLIKTYGSCTKTLAPEHSHTLIPEDHVEDAQDTENSSIQSPQPSTSVHPQEIEIIPEEAENSGRLSPQPRVEEMQDLMVENERLRGENEALKNQVNFLQQEFSKMTDILYHAIADNSKK